MLEKTGTMKKKYVELEPIQKAKCCLPTQLSILFPVAVRSRYLCFYHFPFKSVYNIYILLN